MADRELIDQHSSKMLEKIELEWIDISELQLKVLTKVPNAYILFLKILELLGSKSRCRYSEEELASLVRLFCILQNSSETN